MIGFCNLKIVKTFLLEKNKDRGTTLTGVSINSIVLIFANTPIGIIFCINISCKNLIGEQKLFHERNTDFLTLDYNQYQ